MQLFTNLRPVDEPALLPLAVAGVEGYFNPGGRSGCKWQMDLFGPVAAPFLLRYNKLFARGLTGVSEPDWSVLQDRFQ